MPVREAQTERERLCLLCDPFQGDETDVKLLSDAFVRARYPQQCNICREPIPAGMRVRARREINNEERRAMTFYFCEPCCDAMALVWKDDGRSLEGRYPPMRTRNRSDAMDGDEWIRRQAKAKDEVYDLINKGGTDNLLRAIDVAWREYTNFTKPTIMTAGRKTERLWGSLSDFAKRMVVDAACALAYERSQATR